MSQALREASAVVRAAERQLQEVLQFDYPVGGPVTWMKAGCVQNGVVTRHAYGDRIEVRNHRTGRTRFIYAYDIIQAL
ncbi:MAG: hypothetical protein KIS96_14565 [Bauldia sp.]|nr:hypothetical protein [Bauldia sp.]